MQGELIRTESRIDAELNGLGKDEKEVLVDIIRALRDIRYGYVLITVHDSTVTQIDKTEKLRIGKTGEAHGGGGDWRKKQLA